MGPPNPDYITKYLRCAKLSGLQISGTCVETGTYRGEGTRIFAELFSAVHTIELSEKWHAFSRKALASCHNVTCHQGDSTEVLTRLVPSISEPATFYLDAHFAGGDTAMGKEEVPLLRELEVISRRTYSDLIIIDDLRLIGKSGESGNPGDPIYPAIKFDWRSVTMERIAEVVNCQNRTHWLCEKDRVVIFRRLPFVRGLFLKLNLWAYQLVWRATRKFKRTLRVGQSPVSRPG